MKTFIKEHQVLLAGLFIGIVLIVMFLRKKDDSPAILQAHESERKALQGQIDAAQHERDMYREWKDEVISEKQKADSLLQVKDKILTVKYASVPVYIYSLGKDSLRAEGERTARQSN